MQSPAEASSAPSSSSRYEFWNKIGEPQFVVAPMVDHSELAYRMLTRRYGAKLVYTQMFNANSFVSAKDYRSNNFNTTEGDRPLIVQFAGHDPNVLLQAAKLVEHECDAVDINLGCPQGIAKRGRYGAFLMEELDLLHDMVSTMVKGLKIPVTCKTRIYKDFDRSIKLCETLVNAGASALTIHGRTRDEKGQHVKECDWAMIARIKKHFEGRVPVIANGGIETLADVFTCISCTGCDGVMSSEAILEDPSLFSRDPAVQARRKGDAYFQVELTEEFLELSRQFPPWHMKTVRSHCMKMLHRFVNRHVELRDAIGAAHTIDEFVQVCALTRKYISEHGGTAALAFYQISWYNRYRLQTSEEAGAGEVGGPPQARVHTFGPSVKPNAIGSFIAGGGFEEQEGANGGVEEEDCCIFSMFAQDGEE